MTKQEYIQQAYGEYWEELWEYVYEDGWCGRFDDFQDPYLPVEMIEIKDIDGYEYYRPKILQGIETNNGWISITNTRYPKPSDFLNGTIVLCYRKGAEEVLCKTHNEYLRLQMMKIYTHYQLIEKPNPPLYD